MVPREFLECDVARLAMAKAQHRFRCQCQNLASIVYMLLMVQTQCSSAPRPATLLGIA